MSFCFFFPFFGALTPSSDVDANLYLSFPVYQKYATNIYLKQNWLHEMEQQKQNVQQNC